MTAINHHDLIILLLSMSVMLILSRMAGEFGRSFKLPMVLGEILVGILLGPTLFGRLMPEASNWIFPSEGNASIALEGIVKVSVIMMLFVAGMEVQLPLVLKQGKAAVFTSLFGMIVPFLTGFGVVWYFPELIAVHSDNNFILAMFIGTALSISALPVIARILIDLNMFRTKVGLVIIASAMFIDLIGWLVFSFILASMQTNASLANFWLTIFLIVSFMIFMLTIGRKIIDASLPWIQTRLSWPGGVLSVSLGICFLSAAATEAFGIHAVLGAFIGGVMVGDSVHLREEARSIIHQFVTNIFAPLFFVSIGLKVDFIANFNGSLILLILLLAYASKIFGAALGAKLGGFTLRESLTVGLGLNARGAMEIILGNLALNAGIIDEYIFVAIVIMALLTSITSGTALRWYAVKIQNRLPN
jgi:Kef-type K+ transport system membrane component KefB